MDELVFINGLTHIGGIQVVLQTPGTEFFFDLGLGQTEQAALFNTYVPVGAMGWRLRDYLNSAMAPLAEGIYRADHIPGSVGELVAPLRRGGRYLESAPYFPESDRERVVFTSHLHTDHSGLLPYLNDRQRVVMSSTSVKIQKSLQATGVVSTCVADLVGREHGERMTIGDTTIGFFDIDHDTPGAMGFIAETSTGTLAYTGDWRHHGLHPEFIEAFAAACRKTGVDVLITEASTAQPPGIARWPWGGGIPDELVADGAHSNGPMTERQACDAIAGLLQGSSGLIFLCLHEQHLQRVASVIESAREAGRRLVVEPKTAAFWSDAARRGLCDLDTSTVLSYPSGDSGPQTGLPTVSLDTIRQNRDSFVCQLSANSYGAMLELAMGAGDLVIHANGHPLGSQYPGWATLANWVRQLGCSFSVVDSHGHAVPSALQELIAEARPRRVVPVHSDHVRQVSGDSLYFPRRFERLPLAS